MIGYELWDTRSGNLLESFDTEDQALAAVARTARAHGSGSVESFTLARVDDDEEVVPVAAGADLLARATRSRRPPAPSGRRLSTADCYLDET